jgi:hypothetical protein
MYRSPARAAASFVLALALCSTQATAALPQIDISGFGTAGFAVTDTGKAEFGRVQQQPLGANNEGDVGVDSLFALQGTVHLTDMLSATAQGMVRRMFNTGFQLDIPVFFVKADVTRDLSVRVGRIQLPVFMLSDYRQVGYSSTWVRPPIEVYGQIPLDSDDGADILYRKTVGFSDISAQAFYGKTDATLPLATIQARKIWGVNADITVGPLTLRAGRSQTAFTARDPRNTQLLTAVNAAGFTALANQLNPLNVPLKFTDFGFSLDGTHLTVQGEISKETVGAFLASTDGQYVLAGYRVHKFTPYAMYARQKVTSARTNTTIPRVGALLPLALGVDQLINSVGADQHTFSAGLRWDLHESVDLKLQVDRVSPQGNGLFINVQPGFHGPVTVASMTLDFVF